MEAREISKHLMIVPKTSLKKARDGASNSTIGWQAVLDIWRSEDENRPERCATTAPSGVVPRFLHLRWLDETGTPVTVQKEFDGSRVHSDNDEHSWKGHDG